MNTKCLGFIPFSPEFINEWGKESGGGFFHPPLYLMMQNAEQVYIFEL